MKSAAHSSRRYRRRAPRPVAVLAGLEARPASTSPSLSVPRVHPRSGFTLLEILLALTLSLGLLAVALHFHQQITRLREDLLEDNSRLAAIRQCFDRLALELRSAVPRPNSLVGTAQSLQFVYRHPPEPKSPPGSTRSAVPNPVPAPFRQLRYASAGTNQNGTTLGIERIESPWGLTRSTAESNPDADPADSFPLEPLTPSASPPTTPHTVQRLPAIQHLAFRYWNGSEWIDQWTDPQLPRGIEITLATDPPSFTPSTGLPTQELFRRVIALPCAQTASPDTSPDSTRPLAAHTTSPIAKGLVP